MKKALITAIFCCVAAVAARADLFWYESFPYLNGRIDITSTNLDGSTNWFRHSGSGNDSMVYNHRLEVSATGGTLSRADDVNRPFATVAGSAFTNKQIVYVSFTVNCTNPPTTASSYFASFLVTSSTLHGRVFGLAGSQPGTWRLGISGAAGTANKTFPVDLATNVDYQVVVRWDPVTYYSATLWVNPIDTANINDSTDYSVASADAVAAPAAPIAYAFRQGSSFNSAFFQITNVAVANTFPEAATNVWPTTPVAPLIAYQPKGTTNFVGDAVTLTAVATGQGLYNLNYQWQKNGVNIANPNGNSGVFTITGASTADSGDYQVIVTTPLNMSVTSATATVSVSNPPIPPTISAGPVSTTVYFGQTATLSVTASGPPPLSYQWYYNNSPVGGALDSTISIPNVQLNNGTTGTYRCDVSNNNGTTHSTNAVLSAIAVPVTNIAYLRTLVDSVYYLPTNTTALWSASGVVTVFSDMTGGAHASFIMQDDTAGIGVFVPGGAATAMPQGGDNITVIGTLSQFNGLLQFNVNLNDPAQSIVTNSHNNPLPAGVVLPLNFTNKPTAGDALRLYGSRFVTLTNMYFPAGFTNGTFAGGSTYMMTNTSGESMKFFMNAAMTNLNGYAIPTHAWQVSGPMGVFLGSATTDRSSGYELTPTRIDDIIVADPAPVTAMVTLDNSRATVTWTAQPYQSYTVLQAANPMGPYTPLASGLTFTTTAGQYTDTNTVTATRFYKVASP